MKLIIIFLSGLICPFVSFSETNSRAIRPKIVPATPTSWNEVSATSIPIENGVTWVEETVKEVGLENPIEVEIPILKPAEEYVKYNVNPSQITYLCVKPEEEIKALNVTFVAARLVKRISFSPVNYMLSSVAFQECSLHWAFSALNPTYCSSLYGIYLEMKSYEKRGLPVPQELYDKMNKAVDFYFLMEEAKARRAKRRQK